MGDVTKLKVKLSARDQLSFFFAGFIPVGTADGHQQRVGGLGSGADHGELLPQNRSATFFLGRGEELNKDLAWVCQIWETPSRFFLLVSHLNHPNQGTSKQDENNPPLRRGNHHET